MNKKQNDIEELLAELEQLRSDNKALLKLASHDMRSPLNKIFALVNLLKMSDEPLSQEQQGYLLTMEMILSDGLQRMRNLMDLRAIENEQVKVNWHKVDVAGLVSKLAWEYGPLAERKHIELMTETEPVTTMSDKLILSRIFDLLLSNGLKFSPKNSEIRISLKAGQDYFELSFIDGGYGIKENEIGELFKKFKILSTPATGGESKTGLGLYIAQFNAAKLGGKITFSNDNGSRFNLKIPYTTIA